MPSCRVRREVHPVIPSGARSAESRNRDFPDRGLSTSLPPPSGRRAIPRLASLARNDKGGASLARNDKGGASLARNDKGGASLARNDGGGPWLARNDGGGPSLARNDTLTARSRPACARRADRSGRASRRVR